MNHSFPMIAAAFLIGGFLVSQAEAHTVWSYSSPGKYVPQIVSHPHGKSVQKQSRGKAVTKTYRAGSMVTSH